MADQLSQKPLTPLIPANEAERLAALHRYKILDTPPEAAFDRITRLAARLFEMPTALISLVDESRAWFKSCVGFDGQNIPRDITLCSFSVLTDQPLIIPDTRLDDRFAYNPIVQGEPGVRFYAGAPLLSHDGFNLGTLCLIDSQPHDPLTADQQATLVDLAAMVVDELELRLAAQKVSQSEEKYRTLFESIDEGFCICEMLFDQNGNPQDYQFLEVNPVFAKLTGLEAAAGKTARQLVPDLEDHWIEIYSSVVQTGEPVRFEQQSIAMNRWFNVNAFCVGEPQNHQFAILFTNISDRVCAEAERKQAEVALRDSEELKQRILESSNDCIKVLNLESEILYISQGGLCLLEINDPAPVLNANWIHFWHGEAQERAITAIATAKAGSMSQFQGNCPTLNGTTKWWDSVITPVRDAAGQVVQLVVISRDITQQKQLDDLLHESEAQSRNILESITDGFFALDEHWRFTYINRAAEVLLDRTASGLMGQIIWEAYPGLAGSEFEQLYWRVMRERTAGAVTAFYPDHDRWYEVNAYPAAEGITIYFRNVTAQIQAQAALRQSEERYRMLFESIDQGFCVIEVLFDGNNQPLDYRFLEINPAFEKQTGLIDAQGKRMRELAPNHEAHWFEIYGSVALTGEPIRFENQAAALHRWYDVYAFRIGQPNERKVAILFNDITDRKQAEVEREQLLQREQAARESAENANRIKDEFLAVLSHELRSPLNPILGWIRLLQNGKLDETRQREALATIERNAKLQTQLIEDLLDISRILQGKLTLNTFPVHLSFAISAAVNTMRLAIDAKAIQLNLEMDSDVGQVMGDTTRLQQVVWNLLSNAAKFTPRDGQITLALTQVGNSAQLQVRDTGKGIHPDFLPHVFEHFRQEDGSTTRRFGGLGLGLAIVRQIVEMHGGVVWAESEGENQGATFVVQLPIIPSAMLPISEPAPTALETLGTPLSNIKILVVDDDDTREFQAFVLEQSGATVIAVASGSEALEALDQFAPDVLVSDVGMPDMDGYMLIQQIRRREALRDNSRAHKREGGIPTGASLLPKAIALTAYASENDRQYALAAGFQQHLSKPIEPSALITAVSQLLLN